MHHRKFANAGGGVLINTSGLLSCFDESVQDSLDVLRQTETTTGTRVHVHDIAKVFK
jgi:hypothetical protein